MHIMHLLLAISVVFFAALFLMCFYRERLKHPLVNPLFVAVCAIFLFFWTYATYEYRGSISTGFLTLENISPYICTVIAITPFMSHWLKDFANCAIAFLGFGMFLAMFISPEVEYLFNYRQEAKFIHAAEAFCHLAMGLYGFYLILADRVQLNLKSFAKAVTFMYATIGFGVFLNAVFHHSNFGMNMYGKYSIYFLDIFNSFEATLAAYLIGVLGTITLGFLAGWLLDRLSASRKKEKTTEVETEVPTA